MWNLWPYCAAMVVLGFGWKGFSMTRAFMVMLCLAAVACAGQRDHQVVGGVMGNGDSALVRIGLRDGIGQWGIEAKWQPDIETAWFGFWGTLNTPEVALWPDGALPFWRGLDAQGFLGLHILTNQDFDRVLTMPTVGVRLAPMETMSFVAEFGYPLGRSAAQEQTGWDLNSGLYLVGLEVRF
jgi:hypothetical protein